MSYHSGDQDQDVQDLRRDMAQALRNMRKIARRGETIADELEEAITQHIYEHVPRNCRERRMIKAFREAVKESGI